MPSWWCKNTENASVLHFFWFQNRVQPKLLCWRFYQVVNERHTTFKRQLTENIWLTSVFWEVDFANFVVIFDIRICPFPYFALTTEFGHFHHGSWRQLFVKTISLIKIIWIFDSLERSKFVVTVFVFLKQRSIQNTGSLNQISLIWYLDTSATEKPIRRWVSCLLLSQALKGS